MTDKNIEDAQIINEEQEPKVDAETAFIMVKQFDGHWKASTDLSAVLMVERVSTRTDIKVGTRDIYKFLSEDDLSSMIAAKIIAANKTDTERATQGVRQALSDRDIL
jgi:hypothetical protein